MDGVVIPSDGVPAELKSVEQILKRAAELKKAEPVIAYWCCFWAAQKALKLPNRSKDATLFLMKIIDALEEMKSVLSANEAVTNEAAGAAYVENFALRVFLGADNADRAGDGGKQTIRKFVVAGQFIEVLQCFEGGMAEEMEQKLKYAKWKAADLAKCMREGRTPVPGPPVQEDEEMPFFPSVGGGSEEISRGSSEQATSPPATSSPHISSPRMPQSPRAKPVSSPAGRNTSLSSPGSSRRASHSSIQRPNLPPPISPPIDGAAGPSSGVWSTMATPGVPDSDDEKEATKHELRDRSVRAHNDREESESTPKFGTSPLPDNHVRFAGPDGASLASSEVASTVDFFEEVPPPPPSESSTIFDLPEPQLPPAPTLPTSPPAPTPTTRPSAPPMSPPRSAPPPQPRATPRPSAPPAPRAPAPTPSAPSASALGISATKPPHFSAAPPPPPSRPLTHRERENIQKHCKWAISSLEFDDPETARKQLVLALEMLDNIA